MIIIMVIIFNNVDDGYISIMQTLSLIVCFTTHIPIQLLYLSLLLQWRRLLYLKHIKLMFFIVEPLRLYNAFGFLVGLAYTISVYIYSSITIIINNNKNRFVVLVLSNLKLSRWKLLMCIIPAAVSILQKDHHSLIFETITNKCLVCKVNVKIWKSILLSSFFKFK